MSPCVQAASIAAWNDEAHVVENRALYREKFAVVLRCVNPVLPLRMPDAASISGPRCGGDDAAFARDLLPRRTVSRSCPAATSARDADGVNPGRGFVRIALVATVDECVEAARRHPQLHRSARHATARAAHP